MAQVTVEAGNKFVVVLSAGDADKSGTPDVTLQVFVELPWGRGLQKLLGFGPWNIPVAEMLAGARAACAVLPAPARKVADLVLAAVGVAL